MSLIVVTAPQPLVSAADATIWAPVLADESEARLKLLLGAAQAGIEPPQGWAARAFGVQTLEARFSGFGSSGVRLPCPPLRSVASVKFVDEAGNEQALDAATYASFGEGTDRGGIAFKDGFTAWPRTARRPDAVRIRFQAGYDPTDPQLMPVKQAIVLAATHLRSLATQDLALRSREVDGVGSRTWTVSDAAEKLIHNAVTNLLMPLRVYT